MLSVNGRSISTTASGKGASKSFLVRAVSRTTDPDARNVCSEGAHGRPEMRRFGEVTYLREKKSEQDNFNIDAPRKFSQNT